MAQQYIVLVAHAGPHAVGFVPERNGEFFGELVEFVRESDVGNRANQKNQDRGGRPEPRQRAVHPSNARKNRRVLKGQKKAAQRGPPERYRMMFSKSFAVMVPIAAAGSA